MLRLRPILAPLALAVALVVAGCGVEAGDRAASAGAGTTTTTAGSAGSASGGKSTTTTQPFTPQQQQMADRMAQTYRQLGLDSDQASCLADAMVGIMDGGTTSLDPNAMMDAVNQCDIPMSKLSELGQGTDGTLEGGFKRGFALSLKQQGLTQKQADCVADAYVKEYGTDIGPARDASKVQPLLEGCGVKMGG